MCSISAAGECMTRSPKVVGPDVFAIAALDIMEQKKITSLPVIDDAGRLARRLAPARSVGNADVVRSSCQ